MTLSNTLQVKCDNCGHDTTLYDLVDASEILSRHPESMRRYVRYGDIPAMRIERGVYFKESDIQAKKLQWTIEDVKIVNPREGS